MAASAAHRCILSVRALPSPLPAPMVLTSLSWGRSSCAGTLWTWCSPCTFHPGVAFLQFVVVIPQCGQPRHMIQTTLHSNHSQQKLM